MRPSDKRLRSDPQAASHTTCSKSWLAPSAMVSALLWFTCAGRRHNPFGAAMNHGLGMGLSWRRWCGSMACKSWA